MVEEMVTRPRIGKSIQTDVVHGFQGVAVVAAGDDDAVRIRKTGALLSIHFRRLKKYRPGASIGP
jgi:hypothetical protein